MGVATRKSVQITNRDATPRVMNNPAGVNGMMRGFVGCITAVATDSIASIYILASVPSNAVMHSLRVYSDDIGSSAAAVDVGLYRTTEDGGAVVDADFFKAALSLNAGALNGTDVVQGNVINFTNMETPLWSLLGLSTDPKVWYDICFTATGAIDEAEGMGVRGSYSI